MTTAAAATGTPNAGDTKAAEQKPADSQKPADQKPADQKPADQKPSATTEEKPGDQKAPEPGSKAGDSQEKPKAPAKYALAIPEGARLDAADLTAIETAARAQDLSNEDAQAIVAEHAATLDAIAGRFLEETTADPVYGGEHLADTQRLANLALDRLQPKGTPAGDRTRAVLQKTGYGNHIVFVSLMADVGKLLAEDAHVAGRAGTEATKKSPETVLYPEPAKA